MTQKFERKLRLQHVLVQPVLVWDDGEELAPGPELKQFATPLSRLAAIADSFPAELAALQARLEQSAQAEGDANS